MTTLQQLVDTSDFPIGATRRSIEDRIEKLIDLLDIVDDDPDLEDDDPGEPWLGWPTGGGMAHSQQSFEAVGGVGPLNDDRESDHSDWEDGADDELTLGAPNSNERRSQVNWAAGANYVSADECEVDCEDEGAQCDDEGVIEAL